MSDIVIAEHILSLSHALEIMRKLKVKRHQAVGIFYELTELGYTTWDKRVEQDFPHLIRTGGAHRHRFQSVQRFGDYPVTTPAYHLKVWRSPFKA